MKKLVGAVSEEEKNEIQRLFERCNGLNELAKIVTADNDALYEKLIKDMGETGQKFQDWWSRMANHYQWERHDFKIFKKISLCALASLIKASIERIYVPTLYGISDSTLKYHSFSL